MNAWNRLGPRDRRALRLGLLVLAPALAVSFGLKPILRDQADLRARVREQRDLLVRELALANGVAALARDRDTLALLVRTKGSRLFPGRDPLAATAALVTLVGEQARGHGVLLEAIESRAPAAAGGGLVAVEIAVRGRSDLQGVLQWLRGMETGSRLLRVEQLALARLNDRIATNSRDIEVVTLAAVIRGFVLVDRGWESGT